MKLIKDVYIHSDERFTFAIGSILKDIKGNKAMIIDCVQGLLKPLQVDDDGYKCAWAMIDILLVDKEFDYSDDSSVFDYDGNEGVLFNAGEEE
jgi:hypothetical protein